MRIGEIEIPTVEGDELTRLTPREVVERANVFEFYDKTLDGGKVSNISIAKVQLDIENERIKMWGEQVIDKDGKLVTYFLELRDIKILGLRDGDDLVSITAYIPNAVMIKAEQEIKKAYAEKRYDDVYRMFQEAYTAYPITPKEWQALKEAGNQ